MMVTSHRSVQRGKSLQLGVSLSDKLVRDDTGMTLQRAIECLRENWGHKYHGLHPKNI